MSKSSIPNPSSCRENIEGHNVFWLKAIKLLERYRADCQIQVVDDECVVIKVKGVRQLMYNHDVPRLQAALATKEFKGAYFSEAGKYLYVQSGKGNFVFSMSSERLERCEDLVPKLVKGLRRK